jgi:hypothetical protein
MSSIPVLGAAQLISPDDCTKNRAIDKLNPGLVSSCHPVILRATINSSAFCGGRMGNSNGAGHFLCAPDVVCGHASDGGPTGLVCEIDHLVNR